jgi:methionine sulfoxide reductase heme-binding subunit
MLTTFRLLLQSKQCKSICILIGLLPFLILLWGAFTDALGANPAEYLIRSTGDWTLRMLCLVLTVTPLRLMSGIAELARYRRMLGLLTFFYATLHALCYAGFDKGLDWMEIAVDIVKRPFIWIGVFTLFILTLLAITSFNAAIRKIGAVRWKQLHRLVYITAPAAILHFYWMRKGKHNFEDVWIYAIVLTVLLVFRVIAKYKAIRKNH